MLLDCYLVQKWCEAVRICKRLDGPRLGRGENKGLKRCHRLKEMEFEHSRLSWLVFRIVLFFSSSKWLPSPKFEGTWTCHHLKCSNLWFGRQAHETIIQLRKQLGQAERKKEAARSVVCDPKNHICERNSCGGFETSFLHLMLRLILAPKRSGWLADSFGFWACWLVLYGEIQDLDADHWSSFETRWISCRMRSRKGHGDQKQMNVTKCFINYLESWNKNTGLYDIE